MKSELLFFRNKHTLWQFSLKNLKKTEIDYRNYDDSVPNRAIPVLLPKEIKNKLLQLMKALQINTGSVDFIVTPQNDYYFLEINPMG